MKENLTLVILGPPGSGKDTQVEFLAQKFGLVEISAGDLVREEAQKSAKIEHLMEKGSLVPDPIVEKLLQKKLAKVSFKKGLLFNGYPRDLGQVDFLNQILVDHNRKLDGVIFLEIPDKEAVARLSMRRICSICGHIEYQKPQCSVCGGQLIQRADDTPEAIKQRLLIFQKDTKEVLEKVEREGLLFQINGEQSREAVARDIMKVLKNL